MSSWTSAFNPHTFTGIDIVDKDTDFLPYNVSAGLLLCTDIHECNLQYNRCKEALLASKCRILLQLTDLCRGCFCDTNIFFTNKIPHKNAIQKRQLFNTLPSKVVSVLEKKRKKEEKSQLCLFVIATLLWIKLCRNIRLFPQMLKVSSNVKYLDDSTGKNAKCCLNK